MNLRLTALVGAMVALALAVTLLSWSGPVDGRFWFWFCACLAGELLWVRMPLGGVTVSMASCVHFAVLLVLPLGHAMAATAVSGFLAEMAVLRKPFRKSLFNSAQSSLAVASAAWVIGVITGVPAMEFSGEMFALPLVAAGALYFAVNSMAVSLAVSLHLHMPFKRAWSMNFGGGYELLSNGALFSLGALMATHYVAIGPWGTALAALPLLVAFEGYRRMVQARCKPELLADAVPEGEAAPEDETRIAS